MVPHTVVVDFAVALLATSVLCDLLGRLAEEDDLTTVATWTLGFGVAAAALAILSGFAANRAAAPEGAAAELVVSHRYAGFVVAGCFGACAAWRLAAGGRPPDRGAAVYWLLSAVGLAALIVTAYWGGNLVFVHGVGVRQIG